MAGFSIAQISYSRHEGPGRFRLALAASVATHLFLAESTVTEPAYRNLRFADREPIVVRLEPSSGRRVAVLAEDGENRFEPHQLERAPVETRPRHHDARAEAFQSRKPDDVARFALPPAPDTTVYAAADLDSYPRPLAPLEFERVAGLPDRLRLELVIDEVGGVSRITFADPIASGAPEQDLRALLANIRFVPASKDGRAVRSRVVLNVELVAR